MRARARSWCPRCDQLADRRPGRPCPACATPLVALPPTGRPEPQRAAWWPRLRRTGSALRLVAGILLCLALPLGAYSAGRSLRHPPPAATPAPTTSTDASGEDLGGATTFNWSSAPANRVSVRLLSVELVQGATKLRMTASGTDPETRVIGAVGMVLLDRAGHTMLASPPGTTIPAATSGIEDNGVSFVVQLTGRPADLSALAAVRVQALRTTRVLRGDLEGTISDASLVRGARPAPPSVRLRCFDCNGIVLLAQTYGKQAGTAGRTLVVIFGAPGQEAGLDLNDVSIGNGAGIELGPERISVDTAEDGTSVMLVTGVESLDQFADGSVRTSFPVLIHVDGGSDVFVVGPWKLSAAIP